MRIVYLVVGSLALLLGVIGVLLPVLPTTPFLLLAVFCYARSSEAFEKWLRSSKIVSALCGRLCRDKDYSQS